MHRKQLFIALLLLPLLSAAAGRHSSAPLPAAETAAVRAAAQGQAETEVQAGAAEQATTAGQAVNGGSAGIGGQAGNAGQATFGKYPATEDNSTAEATTDAGEADPAGVDTVIVVDKVQVTAIKQGMVLRSQPVAAAIVGSRAIERGHVDALKNLSQNVPNFYVPDYGSRMTSSIYVRGLGARIDQPVMGLNIDNVPVLNKDNYDMELADAERIEVLRGPQSTLYGRNTMGGVINVYTLSPLAYEGIRLSAEYGSGDSYRFRASSYYRINPDLGMAVTGYYTHTGGFFENLATGEKCDWERMGGGRWKAQWRNRAGLRIDNTLSFSVLEQGGYPYAYVGEEIVHNGQTVIRPGEIRYNDPCSYRRTTLSDGLTVRYDAGSFSVASITSYQYSDDEMILDQDFLPLSYFTLKQARTEHALTEDIVFRSHEQGAYRWLLGAFGFYRHGTMNAPVHFKQTGIEELILKNANEHDPQYTYDAWDNDELLLGSRFRNPSAGGALYLLSVRVSLALTGYQLEGIVHGPAGLGDPRRAALRKRILQKIQHGRGKTLLIHDVPAPDEPQAPALHRGPALRLRTHPPALPQLHADRLHGDQPRERHDGALPPVDRHPQYAQAEFHRSTAEIFGALCLRRDPQPLRFGGQRVQGRRVQHADVLRRTPAEDDERNGVRDGLRRG